MAEEEEKAEETEQPKKSKKKLIIIIVVVLLLVGGGAGFALMGGGSEEGDGHELEVEQEAHYATVEIDSFIVNLNENASFLKVKLLLEYDVDVLEKMGGHGEGGGHGGGGHGGAGAGGGEAEGGLPGVLGEREPMIRDAIIRVLSSKTSEEVLSLEGKSILKEELIDAINEAAGADEALVVNIYFLDFIVQ
ncbi:MAG: flagellar basal body-associated FliL family protein [Bdellovibrionales bacterium]|nr:flagellar basal body-associated FliL family protein [Bdellovibrionales bacterium]